MNCQDYLYRGCDPKEVTRRWFFEQCGVGLGRIALAGLFTGRSRPPRRPAHCTTSAAMLPKRSHYAGRAKAVIHLFMAGAPSHLDLFDHKPKLAEFEGKPIPPSIIGGQRYAFIRSDAAVLGPRFHFSRHGQSGTEIADILPHSGEDRRRRVLHPLDAHRSVQPRAGPAFHQHGGGPAGPAQHGLVGRLRTGGRRRAICRPSS